MIAEMDAKMEVNQVKMDGKQEEMLARMQEDIKSGQAEMRSTIHTFGSELKDSVACRLEAD
jgi:signal transduction histidine kinase